MLDEAKTVGALAAAASAIPGSVTVAAITTPAPGILGVIGLTTTTTVALPIAGIVVVGAALGFGICKGIELATQSDE